MGRIIVGVVVALLIYFGMYATARYRITDRFSTYAREAKGSCSSNRAGSEIDADTVGKRVQAAAETARVELLALRVTVEPLTRANAARAGAVAEAAVQQAHALTHGPHFAGMPGEAPTEEHYGLLAIVNASVRAEQWLWSDERDMETTCVQQ